MQNHPHPMKCWKSIICGCLVAATTITALADNIRFSQQLTPSDRMEIGLQRLSPDELAILDALVRRDEKWYAKPGTPPPSPTRFSQRLSPEECKSAGLDRFDDAHLFRLDVLVSRIEFGNVPMAAAGNSTQSASPKQVTTSGLEIHGMVSFTVGGGSGGYSEMGGAMALMLDDPAHNLSVFVNYEEMHAKGPLLGRDCYIDQNLHAPLGASLLQGR